MSKGPVKELSAEQSRLKAERRARRNRRKAWAEGFLTAIGGMLRPGDLAVDCGANVGVVTRVLAASGADVIAFEPDPFAYGKLTEAFAETPNVRLVNAAVGVSAGTVRLMRARNFDDNPTGGSVKSTILEGGRDIDVGSAIEVELIDFPSWLAERIAERGEIAFLKMDIEGAELDILEDLDRRNLLAQVRCLVAETHERKFQDLRPRYRELRRHFAEKYPATKVNLDWI